MYCQDPQQNLNNFINLQHLNNDIIIQINSNQNEYIMNMPSFHFGSELDRDSINQIIGKIEDEVRIEVDGELQEEFRVKYSNAILSLQKQAEQQLQTALEQLKQEQQNLLKQQQKRLQQQTKLEQAKLNQRQDKYLMNLHQQFIQANFQNIILKHPKIITLQDQIQYQIFKNQQHRHEMKKQRNIKQILLHAENQQIKYRKVFDKQIKQSIYAANGLQDLKNKINEMRIKLGSTKSQYNLKVRKIEEFIRETQKKCKQIQKQGNCQQLRQKVQELKIQLIQKQIKNKPKQSEQNHHQNPLQTQKYPNLNDGSQSSENQSQLEQKPMIKQKTNQFAPSNQWMLQSAAFSNNIHHKKDVQFIQNDVQLDSDDSDDSLDSQQNRLSKAHFQYMKSEINDQFLQPPHRYTFNPQPQHQEERGKKSLLNFKVGELLRQKYEMDPLQKYLDKQNCQFSNNNNNFNKSGNSRSNFGQLYAQHLKKLNKGMNKKPTFESKKSKLSEGAKKAIMNNLAQYCSNFY